MRRARREESILISFESRRAFFRARSRARAVVVLPWWLECWNEDGDDDSRSGSAVDWPGPSDDSWLGSGLGKETWQCKQRVSITRSCIKFVCSPHQKPTLYPRFQACTAPHPCLLWYPPSHDIQAHLVVVDPWVHSWDRRRIARFGKPDPNHEIYTLLPSQAMMWVMTKPEKQKGQICDWVERTESLALELEDRLKAENKQASDDWGDWSLDHNVKCSTSCSSLSELSTSLSSSLSDPICSDPICYVCRGKMFVVRKVSRIKHGLGSSVCPEMLSHASSTNRPR